MIRAAVVLSTLVAGCFTDYEVGGPASSDGTAGGGATRPVATDEDDTADTSHQDADAAGDSSCPDPEPGQGACPPRCSGGCALGTCTITCNEEAPCLAIDLVCPQGWPCVVLCDGQDACPESTVHCSDGPCELQCSEADSCDGVVMMCGVQACNAWCSEDDAGVEAIACGSSCHCQDNCGPGGSSD